MSLRHTSSCSLCAVQRFHNVHFLKKIEAIGRNGALWVCMCVCVCAHVLLTLAMDIQCRHTLLQLAEEEHRAKCKNMVENGECSVGAATASEAGVPISCLETRSSKPGDNTGQTEEL